MHVEIGECVHACEAIYLQLLNNVCATIYFSRHQKVVKRFTAGMLLNSNGEFPRLLIAKYPNVLPTGMAHFKFYTVLGHIVNFLTITKITREAVENGLMDDFIWTKGHLKTWRKCLLLSAE